MKKASDAIKSKFWGHRYEVVRDGIGYSIESPVRQAPKEWVAIYLLVDVRMGEEIVSDMDRMGQDFRREIMKFHERSRKESDVRRMREERRLKLRKLKK